MAKSIAALFAVPIALVISSCSGPVSGRGENVSVSSSASTTTVATSLPSLSALPTPAALADPCSLLTQTEAEHLAGTKLNPPVDVGPAGTKTLCQYTGLTSGPTAQVEVFIGDGVIKSLQIDRDILKHVFRTVPGIGDQTLEEDGNIFIYKDAVWAQINLVLLNDRPAQNRVNLEKAAAIIASRLP